MKYEHGWKGKDTCIFCLVKQNRFGFLCIHISCWTCIHSFKKQLLLSLCTSLLFYSQLFFRPHSFAFLKSEYEPLPPSGTHTYTLYFRCQGMSITSITIRTIDHAATKQLDDICHNTLLCYGNALEFWCRKILVCRLVINHSIFSSRISWRYNSKLITYSLSMFGHEYKRVPYL